MKTNHRRGFKAKKHTDKSMQSWGRTSTFSSRSVGADVGNDFCGSRGKRRAVAGAKKFVRSRIRFADNAKTRELLRDHQ